LFPPSKWQGIIFSEHVHRLIASGIGFLTLILAVWVALAEKRRWVRTLAAWTLIVDCIQGILGGMTVRYLLPAAISVAHGVLAQSVFIMAIVLASAFSLEYSRRRSGVSEGSGSPRSFRLALLAVAVVYIQLIFGAIMR